MKKHLCHLLAATAFFFAWQNVAAQNDSLLDLGRIKIRKDFTQTITIKGSDLQKIPFGTISEVIAPWLHGAMTNRPNLVFVVDGSLVNDVNAWSIYDIEEITLVQNSLVNLNGAINQQQLVLVKTKRNSGESGFTFAGSSALAKNYADDPISDKSETNFYHQYHVAARKKLGKVSVGASANWVRDVYPLKEIKGLETKTPRELNRFRINGWLDVDLAEGHTLSAGLNYVPQSVNYDYELIYSANGLGRQYGKQKQSLINPYLKLSNRIGGGFTNELSVSYLSAKRPGESTFDREFIFPSQPSQYYISQSETKSKSTNLLIREQISYSKKLGDWLLEPSLNFTYRSIKERSEYIIASSNMIDPPSIQGGMSRYEMDCYVLTPAFGISYKNSFNLAGGVSASLTDDTKPMGDGVFPFASVMVDVLRIRNAGNPQSLKIFGSFAKAANFADAYFSQQSVSTEATPTYVSNVGPIFGGGVILPRPFPDNAKRYSLNLGANFATAGDEFQISYNFNDRRYVDVLIYQLPTPQGIMQAVTWPDYRLTSHRLGVMARIAEEGKFQWLTGINVTTFKLKTKMDQVFSTTLETVSNNDKANWTGGFTNRLQLGKFALGLDLQYIFNEQRPVSFATYKTINSWRLNTLYGSYSLPWRDNHSLELYLTARNAFEDDHASFPGNYTKYYGAGFKLQF